VPVRGSGSESVVAQWLAAGVDARPRLPAGVVGPGGPGHALMLTLATSMIKVRALPSRRVLLHADHRYYDPLGLRCPPADFTIGLYRGSLPDAGQADGSLLFRTRPCTRAAFRTPRRPSRLTPEQGPPGMAFAGL
jgi:hypothetical protein